MKRQPGLGVRDAGRTFPAHLWSLRYDGSSPSSFDGTDYVELTDHTGDPAFTPDVGTLDRVSRRMRR